MGESDAAAFWSYAHEDDQLDEGAIVRLAERLEAEYSLITGRTLDLFVDRTGIPWGTEWRARIGNALVQTTFFIPVLSPRYFTREECRRELLEFAAQAESLGVGELILPILYAAVPGFTSENPDEAVALTARMQYVDWTDLRLSDVGSPEQRRAVNRLAQRLADVASEIAARQVEQEVQGDSETALGLSETLEAIAELLPDWLTAVEIDPVLTEQIRVTVNAFGEKRRRSGPAGARFAVLQREAAELLPLAQRHLEFAEVYSSRTIALEPAMRRIIRIAEAHPDAVPALSEMESALKKAKAEIVKSEKQRSEGWIGLGEYAERYAHTSRAMSAVRDLWQRASELVYEANATVLRWDSECARFHDDFEEIDK